MKLIILQPYLNIKGGAEKVILEVAKHYTAQIYTLEYEKNKTYSEFEDVDIKIIGKKVPFSNILPYRASQGLRYGYNFYNLKIKEDYDVLNPHISPSEWVSHKNKNILWYCHTPPREVYDLYKVRMQGRSIKDKLLYSSMVGTYKFIASKTIKKIDNIATNSENTRKRIETYFSRSAVVIPPGIDYKAFNNKGDERYFLYPSRIIVNKQQDYVIRAFKVFSKLIKNDKKYSLVLAGTLSNDPEHKEYLKRLKSLSNNLNVKFITNASEERLRSLYSSCTAVLFASKNEDYGLVPLEGMASSKPVISINEGGPKETIRNNKDGFLVNSEEEMAKRMLEIVQNPALAEELGKNGRNRVIKRYSWNNFFKNFDILLEKTKKDTNSYPQ
ncbi:MAG: glycosyltransferase [Candidatus Micrarchaeia archaeon]